jgi:parallel beta-helix repeat protein
VPTDLKAVEPIGVPPEGPSRTDRVRAALSGRRLVVGLVVLLLVPGLLGAAALSYQAPGPAPAPTAEPHDALPQAPDSVARAQLDRSAQATRLARRLTAPALLDPSDTGGGRSTLATLAVAPRTTPYTMAELRELEPAAFSDVPGESVAVLVEAHIDVPVGATLVVDEQTPDVRLASSPAGFATITSRGTVQVSGTADRAVRISSWNTGTRATDTDIADGRSFVLQIGGRMDVDHARFEFLGFGTGTSSGVAWRGAAADSAGATTRSIGRAKAQGTVTSSVFAHNHFGAYTHEAQAMVWENNTFADNTEYGFDPHDFSNAFTVVGNTAHHNGKHGFIFSRGCDDNVLRNNYAYANVGHGFMIDDGRTLETASAESRLDTSDNNLVIDNVAEDNANSGVEIEGGTGNVVSGNQLARNDIGVRIKDGAAASVTGNVIDGSDRYGINVLDSAGQVPVTDNQISGSWAAINLATAGSATLTANTSVDVTTPLVVDSIVTYDTSWLDQVGKYLRWNPVLVLWGLILGLPVVTGLIRVVELPFLHRRRAVHGS